ncbi:MAG: M28 family peptidase [Bacteroidota bacterium]
MWNYCLTPLLVLGFSFLMMGLGCESEQRVISENKATNIKIERIKSDISADSIEANIRTLSSFYTRHTSSDTASDTSGIGAARRWINTSFKRYSSNSDDRLKVMREGYVESDHAAIEDSAAIVNVVAMLPGTQLESKDRMYVVSAHYDSRTVDPMDNKSRAPGANDNASGTAAVLELARVLSNYEFDATIVFVAFAGKEQGLLGSRYSAVQSSIKNRNIRALINNDIIGNSSRGGDGKSDNQLRVFTQGVANDSSLTEYHQGLISNGGENDTPSRQLGRLVYQVSNNYMDDLSVEMVYRKDRLGKQGDHLPFLKKGYPSVRLTEADENFNLQHQRAEQREGKQIGDLPAFIDYKYAKKVTSLNAAVMATLADAPTSPKKVKMIKPGESSDLRLQWKKNKEPDFKGYEVVWRKTHQAHWQNAEFIGDTLKYSSEGINKDDYIFGVRSVDNYGNKSRAVYPIPVN